MKKNLKILLILMFLVTANAKPLSLVGTYKLISMESLDRNGEWVSDCVNPAGLLIYNANQYMAVGINCMKDVNTKAPSEQNADMIFYIGKYKVEKNKVIHYVENTSEMNLYHKKLVRQIVLLPHNQMILLADSEQGKHFQIKWQKISN